ncbi:MAG TPA: hypothetical protein VN428_01910, partial [Bryobacteraceae bacterium]|nr:hypothetical protein [Bryobacteraceae bacterium]
AALAASALAQSDTRIVQLPETDETRKEIDGIFETLAKITGLEPKRAVEFSRIERAGLKPFLEERVKEVVKPEELRAEEAALKKFGFVPQNFDLKKTTIDLLSEQAAAFYDFRKHKLFLIGGGEELMQHTVLVHELAHALADQHFDLEKYIESGRKSDDGALARMAVMEGQATWLMSEYLAHQTGNSLEDSPVLVKMMSTTAAMDTDRYPVFASVPLYLKESLIFPYTKGMLFQHELFLKKRETAFSEPFRKPPASTQQILHPEKYLEGVKPVRPKLPDFAQAGEYKDLTDGEIGEFDHAILLRQYGGDELAKELAPEWRGGFFKLLERKKDSRQVLVYASQWSGAEAAGRYFAAYRKVLQGKWKRMMVKVATATELSGTGDDGAFTVTLDGVRVTSVEGK